MNKIRVIDNDQRSQLLLGICNNYLKGRLSTKEFIETYQIYFEDNQERLENAEFDIFDEIYMACEYYQPNPEIREIIPKLIDEERLRQIISQEIKKITI